jgi:hypothetical protein
MRSWPEVTWSDGEELHERPKVLVLFTEKDMHGLEALGLTRRSRQHRLEYSWVSCLVLILMKVVNENGGGGQNLVSPHKWKAWKS